MIIPEGCISLDRGYRRMAFPTRLRGPCVRAWTCQSGVCRLCHMCHKWSPPCLGVQVKVTAVTQFYSVGFSQSGISEEKWVPTNTKSRLLFLAAFWRRPGTLRNTPDSVISLYIYGRNAFNEVEGPWRTLCQLVLQRSETKIRKFAGRNGREKYSPVVRVHWW